MVKAQIMPVDAVRAAESKSAAGWRKSGNAEKILGMQLVTKQTDPPGKKCSGFIEEGMEIIKELYCSVLVDRTKQSVVMLHRPRVEWTLRKWQSTHRKKSSKFLLIHHWVCFLSGIRTLLTDLNRSNQSQTSPACCKTFQFAYQTFVHEDCSLVEINPLVLTGDDRVVALDAKLSFDDNALFRHRDNVDMRDLAEEDPLETEAGEYELNYIKLDGSIGCMVNGAGLAMGTMDIIKPMEENPRISLM